MKSLLLFFFQIILISPLMSQSIISGTAADAEGRGVEMALVGLFDAQDSSLVKSTFTESSGLFVLDRIEEGSYFVTISLIGFTTYSSDVVTIDQSGIQIELPKTTLESLVNTTKTIEVTAMQSAIEIKADKVVMRPDAMISNASATVWDLIQKAPGVIIGANEELMLRGRQGVIVYQDDRPMYLSGSDLVNALKGMPASAIETIEIITTPNSKYDASGNAGIIVLRIKKNKLFGWSGGVSLAYGQGFYHRTNNSGNFSYRINKFNFYGNLSYVENNSYQDLKIKRNFFSNEGAFESAFQQRTWLRRGNTSMNGRVGVDYYVNAKLTMGASFGGFRDDSFGGSDNVSLLADANGLPLGRVEALNPSERIFENYSANWNFSYQIDTLGKTISGNADYLNYNSVLEQSLVNVIYDNNNVLTDRTNLISDLPSNIDIVSAQLDYTQPIGTLLQFGAGGKWSNVSTTNVADFRNEENGLETPNYDFSNDFKYDETISALYTNLTYTKNKISVQAGLRAEDTDLQGDQEGNLVKPDSTFSRSFTNLFPTLFVMYQMDSVGNHVLTFNAGRRIDRPNYQDMNPFTYPMDQFTLYTGNPYLRPMFSYNTELAYTYKNKVTTSLNYYLQKDVINETIRQDGSIFYSRPGNLGEQHSFGISMNVYTQFKKKYSFQCYTELMNNIVKSELNGRQLNNRGAYWYVGPTVSRMGDKGWGFEVGGFYQTRVVSGQFKTIAVGGMRVAGSKKFWNNNATLRLVCDDIFHSNLPGGDIRGLGASTASWKSRLDTQVVTLSFSYRFTKGNATKARSQSAADSERARVR
jgi:hypothetical protein